MKKDRFLTSLLDIYWIILNLPAIVVIMLAYVSTVGIRTGIMRQKPSTYGKALAEVCTAAIPFISVVFWIAATIWAFA